MALGDYRDIFNGDAKLIADALFGSLPGGTLDRLLLEFLERKACLWKVGWPNKE